MDEDAATGPIVEASGRESLTQLLSDFRGALAWMRNLGLKVQVGRFAEYERICAKLGGGDPEAFTAQDQLALVEIGSAGRVWRQREQLSRISGLEERLQTALGGNRFYADDGPKSHVARNTFFELEIAALLADLGLDICPADSGDVAAHWFDELILVECKRPFSEAAVTKNVKEASRQIRERRCAEEIGVPCVDFTLLTNPSLMHFKVESDAAALMVARHLVDEIAKRYRREAVQVLKSEHDAFVFGHLVLPFWHETHHEWLIHYRRFTFGNPGRSWRAGRFYAAFDAAVRGRLGSL